MAKISELTNKQLVQQLEKYKKISDKLLKEREKRILGGVPRNYLLMEHENSIVEDQGEDASFSLELSAEDLKQVEEIKAKQGGAEEEARVTQLLQLTKKQLENFNKKKNPK